MRGRKRRIEREWKKVSDGERKTKRGKGRKQTGGMRTARDGGWTQSNNIREQQRWTQHGG
jgi:myosin-crossreactive antigen